MEVGGVTLTWLLIAALTTGFSGTLGGWLHSGHKAGCERRSRVFVQAQWEQGVQGPVHEC
jgi:hypothetical protein